jgi:hypothetical protein
MSPNRTHIGLAALLLVVLTGLPAFGQDHELQGMQLFEEADVRPYGNWAHPREGFFLTFDGIYWHISAPDKTTIGAPHLTRLVFLGVQDLDEVVQSNTLDTGEFRNKWKQGDRIELGYVSGHHGFMVDTFELNGQTMMIGQSNVPVVFNDPAFGPRGQTYLEGIVGNIGNVGLIAPIPVVFSSVQATNKLKIQGVEAMYMYRPHQLHLGGNVEFFLGGRYLRLDDDFFVFAAGGALADSNWDIDVKNNIFGPQAGVRWYRPFGRFALSTEGRFMAGVNAQNARQTGMLGSFLQAPNNSFFLPRLMNATGFDNTQHFYEFSPLAEFRVEGHVQITRNISAKAGFTCIWMDGVARASDMIDYTVPSLGITTARNANRQELLMYGLNLGLELAR